MPIDQVAIKKKEREEILNEFHTHAEKIESAVKTVLSDDTALVIHNYLTIIHDLINNKLNLEILDLERRNMHEHSSRGL